MSWDCLEKSRKKSWFFSRKAEWSSRCGGASSVSAVRPVEVEFLLALSFSKREGYVSLERKFLFRPMESF